MLLKVEYKNKQDYLESLLFHHCMFVLKSSGEVCTDSVQDTSAKCKTCFEEDLRKDKKQQGNY